MVVALIMLPLSLVASRTITYKCLTLAFIAVGRRMKVKFTR
jgi:hypothetical protein